MQASVGELETSDKTRRRAYLSDRLSAQTAHASAAVLLLSARWGGLRCFAPSLSPSIWLIIKISNKKDMHATAEVVAAMLGVRQPDFKLRGQSSTKSCSVRFLKHD
jgi:hypothetical protein